MKNSSFETGDFSGWNVYNLSGVSPGNGPQVVTTGGPDPATIFGDIVPKYDGTKAAYFVDDTALQAITQTVRLAANTTYSLNFGLFATVSGAAAADPFVLIDGISGVALNAFASQTVAPYTGVPVGVWTPESATYTTTVAGDYTLGFIFVSAGVSGISGAKDVMLDGVSLTAMSAVPLPSSAPMFGAALIATGAAGFGVKRKKDVAA